MQKKTRSILEELDSLHFDKDKRYIVESRASNVIASAVRLVEQLESLYSPEEAEMLTRKLLSAIKAKDPSRFVRSLKRTTDASE